MRVILAGSGEFGIPSLRTIIHGGHEVVQVISQPDRPAGRGRKLTPTPLAQAAIDQKLDVVRTDDINALSLPSADVLVVIAFGQKIGPQIVGHPKFGSINLHASLLPKYRGAAPINWAILGGETVTGNSVIRLAMKMDAGAILRSGQLEIEELETAGELHDRLGELGGPLVFATLSDLERGRATETVQDESQATLAPKLKRETSLVDWNKPAERVARQIRGLFPWPGCRVKIGQDVVTLCRARAVNITPEAASTDPDPFDALKNRNTPPGAIDENGNVFCGQGAVEIVELQPAGKRPMPLDAYRNGHRWDAGTRLEPVA